MAACCLLHVLRRDADRGGVTFWAQQGEVIFAFDADSEAVLRVFDTNWAVVEHYSRTDNTLFDIFFLLFIVT